MLFTHSYSKRRSIARPDVRQIGLSLGTVLVSVGAYSLTARVLGTEAFGVYAFLQWLTTITVPLIGIGMSALTSQRIVNAQGRETPASIAGVFYFLWYRQCRRIVWYSLLYLLLALPLSWFIPIATPQRLLLGCLAVLPLFLRGIVSITLRSLRRLDLLATLYLGGALITFTLVIIVNQISGLRLEIFLLAFALAGTLTLIMAVITIARLLPLKGAQMPGIFLRLRLEQHFKQAFLHFFIDAVVWQRSELLLLAFWRQPEELGFYAVSALVSSCVMRLTPAILSLWLLRFFLQRNPGYHYVSPYDAFVKTSCYMVFMAVPICILVTVLGPLAITNLLGGEYLPLMQPLRILLIASVFGSIATVSLTRLAEAGQEQAQQRIGLGVALLNILLSFPCIARWGIAGAALASASAQIMSAICLLVLCGKMLLRQEMNLAKDGI